MQARLQENEHNMCQSTVKCSSLQLTCVVSQSGFPQCAADNSSVYSTCASEWSDLFQRAISSVSSFKYISHFSTHACQ